MSFSRSETESLYLAASINGMLDHIYTDGYENDEADRPLGNVYHMMWQLWKNDENKDLKTTKRTDYNDLVNIVGLLPHHRLRQYGKQFLAYKNGVMKPKDFDKDATETDIKNAPQNLTIDDSYF